MKSKLVVSFLSLSGLAFSTSLCSSDAASPGQATGLLETHQSLRKTPLGTVELAEGKYNSVMLGQPVPYRVFGPVDPKWENDGEPLTPDPDQPQAGLSLVVDVLNLSTPDPRPSCATDREIIQDLVRRQFLVVAVDCSTATHLPAPATSRFTRKTRKYIPLSERYATCGRRRISSR